MVAFRTRAGVTKDALARALNVSFTTVHRWERAACAIPFGRLAGIAHALKLTHEQKDALELVVAVSTTTPHLLDRLPYVRIQAAAVADQFIKYGRIRAGACSGK